MRRAPLAAAAIAALTAVLAGCTSVGNPPNAPGSVAGKAVTTLSASGLAHEAIPPYFITLAPTGWPPLQHPLNLTVRATLSGEVVATVLPPKPFGTFGFVGGSTSDDRTFLVGAQRWRTIEGTVLTDLPVSFFLLRFDPAGDH